MNTQPISGMSNRDVRESLVFLFALDDLQRLDGGDDHAATVDRYEQKSETIR